MYSKLSNNVKMPLIGLGTYLLDNKKIEKIATEAIKIGYRHFDTAQMYNNSIGLGKAISNSKIPRKDLFITSKQWGHYTFEIAKIRFMETLSMLKIDYIDLYLIHWPSHDY